MSPPVVQAPQGGQRVYLGHVPPHARLHRIGDGRLERGLPQAQVRVVGTLLGQAGGQGRAPAPARPQRPLQRCIHGCIAFAAAVPCLQPEGKLQAIDCALTPREDGSGGGHGPQGAVEGSVRLLRTALNEGAS